MKGKLLLKIYEISGYIEKTEDDIYIYIENTQENIKLLNENKTDLIFSFESQSIYYHFLYYDHNFVANLFGKMIKISNQGYVISKSKNLNFDKIIEFSFELENIEELINNENLKKIQIKDDLNNINNIDIEQIQKPYKFSIVYEEEGIDFEIDEEIKTKTWSNKNINLEKRLIFKIKSNLSLLKYFKLFSLFYDFIGFINRKEIGYFNIHLKFLENNQRYKLYNFSYKLDLSNRSYKPAFIRLSKVKSINIQKWFDNYEKYYLYNFSKLDFRRSFIEDRFTTLYIMLERYSENEGYKNEKIKNNKGETYKQIREEIERLIENYYKENNDYADDVGKFLSNLNIKKSSINKFIENKNYLIKYLEETKCIKSKKDLKTSLKGIKKIRNIFSHYIDSEFSQIELIKAIRFLYVSIYGYILKKLDIELVDSFKVFTQVLRDDYYVDLDYIIKHRKKLDKKTNK